MGVNNVDTTLVNENISGEDQTLNSPTRDKDLINESGSRNEGHDPLKLMVEGLNEDVKASVKVQRDVSTIHIGKKWMDMNQNDEEEELDAATIAQATRLDNSKQGNDNPSISF